MWPTQKTSRRNLVFHVRPVFGLASLEEHAAYPGSDQEAVRVAKLDDVLDGDVGFARPRLVGHGHLPEREIIPALVRWRRTTRIVPLFAFYEEYGPTSLN